MVSLAFIFDHEIIVLSDKLENGSKTGWYYNKTANLMIGEPIGSTTKITHGLLQYWSQLLINVSHTDVGIVLGNLE